MFIQTCNSSTILPVKIMLAIVSSALVLIGVFVLYSSSSSSFSLPRRLLSLAGGGGGPSLSFFSELPPTTTSLPPPSLNCNPMFSKLLRQTARWSVAAHQDKNPIIKLLHANYGAGYLWSLKDIAKEDDIEQCLREMGSSLSLVELESFVISIQDSATKGLTNACPSTLMGDIDMRFLSLAGDA